MLKLLVTALLLSVSACTVQPERPEQLPNRYLYDDFRRHPVREIYHGVPAPVELDSHPQARQFRTRLSEGAKHGPNFAGHYTVVEWGCGTNCQQLAVVDARSGRVSDWLTSELGSDYRLDSRLLIKNPDLKECAELEWCKTEYYLFEAGSFVLLK